MTNETTKTGRIVMTIVAVIGGLYLMLLAPTQAMQTLKIALDQVMLRLVPHDADFYPARPCSKNCQTPTALNWSAAPAAKSMKEAR